MLVEFNKNKEKNNILKLLFKKTINARLIFKKDELNCFKFPSF